ncbi:MAG TPA: SCO family protein [Ignavibacteria bacterium]|nr:SCO family protein [Ignavibacteria bacterium]
MYKFLIHILILFVSVNIVFADEPSPSDVGIDEKLGETVPSDITFFDEYGKPVTMGQLLNGKPTVVAMVYYRCPGICSPLMNGVADVVDMVDLYPGKDYNVVTISFDPSEDYILANDKKKNYLASMNNPIDENGWRFLTSDSANIARICNALGWKYLKQGNDYAHSAAIMVLSPEGKIARYLYGIEYNPFDFKMAITEASEGRTGATISKLMKLCYSYDPVGRTYVLDVTRIAGAVTLFLLAIFVVFFIIKKKKKINRVDSGDVGVPVNPNFK